MAGKSDTIGVNAMTLASRQFQTDLQRVFLGDPRRCDFVCFESQRPDVQPR